MFVNITGLISVNRHRGGGYIRNAEGCGSRLRKQACCPDKPAVGGSGRFGRLTAQAAEDGRAGECIVILHFLAWCIPVIVPCVGYSRLDPAGRR